MLHTKRLLYEPLETRLVLDAGPLVISELMAINDRTLADVDGDFVDWIEIHNPTDATIDLAGWYLTDNEGNLRKWQFPDGPQGQYPIEADEYLVVFASQKDRTDPLQDLHTNFKLSGGGEYLALVRPDGTTVASAFTPEYPQQFEDVSFGPTTDPGSLSVVDGADLTYRIPTDADSDLGNAWTASDFDDSAWTGGEVGESSVLITEVGTDTADFIEIQNVSPGTVNTTGWQVIANNASTADINAWHATTWNLPSSIGPGDVLYRSDGPDEVDHPWGEDIKWRTTGSGWAMILDDDGHVADFVVWGYSAPQIASMSVAINNFDVTPGDTWNGPAVPAEGDRHLSLQRSGDSDHENASDWAFTPAPSLGLQNADLDVPFSIDLSNGIGYDVDSTNLSGAIRVDVQADMHTVNPSLWMRVPFSVGTLAGLNKMLLRMQYNDGFVAYLNGQEIARRNAPDLPEWNSTATVARSVEDSLVDEEIDISGFLGALQVGTNVLAIHGMNTDADDHTFLILPDLVGAGVHYFVKPTPGAENAAGLASLGPLLRNVTEDPTPPAGNEDLTITAEVTASFAAVDKVRLHYRVDFGSEYDVPMVDDGSGGDAVAGDGVFTGIIPRGRYGPGDMVRWYVTSGDTSAMASREPAFLDSSGQNQSPEYYGTVVIDPALSSVLPIFQWFAVNPSAGHTRGGTRAALFSDGRFYDNIFVRQRGQATNAYSQKFDFNKSFGFYVNDEIGRVGEFNLNAQGADPAYVRQTLSFETFPDAGNAASESFMTLVHVNGNFDRVGIFIEQVDETFLERNDYDPSGALYKFVQRRNLDPVFNDTITGIEKKTRLGEDFSDIQAVVDGLNLPTAQQRRAFVFDAFNVPQLITYLAVRSVILDADDVRKNFYLYRDTEDTGLWSIFPWDKDFTFGVRGDGGSHLAHPFFGDYAHRKANANQWNVLYEVIFNDPITREMYLRRLRTVMDEVLQPPNTPSGERLFEQRVSELLASVAPHVYISSSRINGLKNFFPARRQELYVDHGIDNWTPGNDVAGIPHAQIGNPPIQIGSVEYAPASANQDEEFIELVNTNTFAVDISGWQLSRAVEHTFLPGTVIPAGRSLYVTPSARAFRSRGTNPTGGQSLFVQGNYRGHLSSFGETIRLLGADGAEVDSLTYGGDPSEAQKFLRITEVMYNPHKPTQAEINAGFLDHDEFEYIELINTGATPLTAADLDGTHFTEGVVFTLNGVTLDPGQRVVVVQNQDAFEARYGHGPRIAGEFTSGRLDNNGEQIKLEDATNGTVVDFVFDDGGQWPDEADGTGASLEIVDTGGDYGDPENWQYGTKYGGTPGAEREARLGVVVNEVLTHTDPPADRRRRTAQHDLQAPSTLAAGIVSDDFGWDPTGVDGNYKKFRIPDGTVYPAGGYVIVSTRAISIRRARFRKRFPARPNDFALNGAQGDDVWLMRPTATGTL